MTNQPMIHEDLGRREAVHIGKDRSFGIVFAVVFTVVGLWPLIDGDPVRLWSLGIAAAFLAIAIVRPALLHPLNRAWMAFGRMLHAIVSPVALGVVFYLAVWPTALFARLTGKDPLRRRFDPTADSYWIDREPPGPDPESMRNQF
jgi:hypothetical protein